MGTARFSFITNHPTLFAPTLSSIVMVTLPALMGFIGSKLSSADAHEKSEAIITINNIKLLMQEGDAHLSQNNPDHHAALRVLQNAKLLIDQFNIKYKKILSQEHLITFNEHILKLYNNIAASFYHMHRYPRALEMIQTLLAMDSDYREGHNLKGMINLRLYLFKDGAAKEEKLNYLTQARAAFNASMIIDQNQHNIYVCQLFVITKIAKETSELNLKTNVEAVDNKVTSNLNLETKVEAVDNNETSKLNLETIVETLDNIIDDENKIVSPWATELMIISALTYHQLKDFVNSTVFYDYALNLTPNTPAFHLDKAHLYTWAATANLDLAKNYIVVTEPVHESKEEAKTAPAEKLLPKLTPEEKHRQYNIAAQKLREKAKLYQESVKPVTPPVQPITSQNRYRDWLPSTKNMLIGGGTVLTGLAACVAFKSKLSNKP